MDDVRQYIYGAILIFVIGVVTWISFIFYNACGLSFACKSAQAKVDRTPIPSLVPGTLPAFVQPAQAGFNKCKVGATDFLAAWVNAGTPEKDEFTFIDMSGQNCSATFAKDLWPLMNETNTWYRSSLACTDCHSSDLAKSDAQLDLTSYAGMMAGSQRADASTKGQDIFGGGHWEKSKLYELMVTHSVTANGHPADLSASGPAVYVGAPVIPATATPVPVQSVDTPTATP